MVLPSAAGVWVVYGRGLWPAGSWGVLRLVFLQQGLQGGGGRAPVAPGAPRRAAPGHGAPRVDGAGRTRRVAARTPRLGDARERGAPPVGPGGAGPAGRAPCRGLPRVRQRRREAGRRRGHPRSGGRRSPGSACRRRSARPGSRGGSAGAVEDGMRRAEGAAATALQEALLAAARNALAEVEILAGESIVAPHGGKLVAHRLVPGQPVRAGETVAQVRAGPKTLGRRWPSYRRRTPGSSPRAWPRRCWWRCPDSRVRARWTPGCWKFPHGLPPLPNGLPTSAFRHPPLRTCFVWRWTIRRACRSPTVRAGSRGSCWGSSPPRLCCWRAGAADARCRFHRRAKNHLRLRPPLAAGDGTGFPGTAAGNGPDSRCNEPMTCRPPSSRPGEMPKRAHTAREAPSATATDRTAGAAKP